MGKKVMYKINPDRDEKTRQQRTLKETMMLVVINICINHAFLSEEHGME